MGEVFMIPIVIPSVSIIIPTLNKRPEGLKRMLRSILALEYPKEKLQTLVIIDEPRLGVPKRVKEGVESSTGEFICFMADDTEFTPDSLQKAVTCSILMNKALVAFNTGGLLPDEGNINTHFIIRRNFIPQIDGEIFDTDLQHLGVDNLLHAKAKKLGEFVYCERAVINHYHFTKGAEFDSTYEIAWSSVEADRKILDDKLKNI